MSYSQLYQSLSSGPGVYIFLDEKDKILYVGKAKNLKKRVSSYFRGNLGRKTGLLVSQIKKIKTIKVESEIESLLLEINLIQKYAPKYNVRFADNKSYPMIRITVKDRYPKVLTVRKIDDKNDVYFGPFPNVGAMRAVLKMMRRIFPFQSVQNHPKKICFYNHIGLCPCPEVIKDPFYRNNINHLVNFLKGNTKNVLRDLEKERNKFSKEEMYEKALETQKRMDWIKLVTSAYYNPILYEENPNLREDIREKELESLKDVLNKNGVKITFPERIECYDVSIISGKYAVGSMVVFTHGEKNPNWYRRFKIKGIFLKNNDFAMMEEVIGRRLNHSEWPRPNLIIVDGGKGQVSSALKVLGEKKEKIPVIGLAKREEIIITSAFIEIKLPKDSIALHLVMRIRDEAHRFAITYHRKLRSNFINL